MSWYLTIRSDACYSRFTQTAPLAKFLTETLELQQTGALSFQAVNPPWVQIIMAHCNENGDYAIHEDSYWEQINVVELICPYEGGSQWYEALAGRIAAFLGWSAFEDSEERQAWPDLAFPPNGLPAG
ncbi:MAG: hypothetical protein FWC42_09780 [Proteobacteria bacterium]|nr:hypothetical protein [Pseudomonadota bacterium]